MGILKKSIFYRFGYFIKTLYQYERDKHNIAKPFYSEDFKKILKDYLGVNFKRDWVGRLYGVLNPYINSKGKVDFSNTILEIDGHNTNDTEYVKHWIVDQMVLVGNLFKTQVTKLYTYIDFDIRHVGPLNADNFLVTFDIVSRKEFASAAGKFFLQLFIYAIIAGISLLMIF